MTDDPKAVSAAADPGGSARVPRLISRLYRSADPAARAGLLAALMRPLGPLGLAAVASGAFAGFVTRRRGPGIEVGLEDAGRFTSDQVFELARFVEQVDVDALRAAVGGVVASPAGYTAFGVAVALLVLRWVHRRGGE